MKITCAEFSRNGGFIVSILGSSICSVGVAILGKYGTAIVIDCTEIIHKDENWRIDFLAFNGIFSPPTFLVLMVFCGYLCDKI